MTTSTSDGWDTSNPLSEAALIGKLLAAPARERIRAELAKVSTGTASRSEPDLLTATEAATILNIAPSTLRDWANKGYGPCVYRLGPRQFRWDRREVLHFVASRRSDGAA